MPELPEVETVRRGLARAMEGRRIDGVRVARRDLRRPLPADFEERLTGRTVTSVGRRAKYLTVCLDDGGVLLAHLGMSGRMIGDENGPGARPSHPLADHEHVTFVLGNRTFVRFADPRRFGMMDWVAEGALADHPLIAHLGPEPTGADFDGDRLWASLERKRTPIKAALLDQRWSPGSAIFMSARACSARASRPAASPPMWGPYAPAAWRAPSGRPLPRRSTRADRRSATMWRRTASSVISSTGSRSMGARRALPGCDCGGAVRRIVQSGRSTFYCAARQR